jgi:ADP-heptose:LPS heptosyltransferase
MRILASNPDGVGDLILRQPLYAALAGAGHELMLLTRPHAASVAAMTVPSARVETIPIQPYDDTTSPIEDAKACEALFKELKEFSPQQLLIAPYQWTKFEQWLVGSFPTVPAIGFNGGLYPATISPRLRSSNGLALAQTVPVEKNSHEWEKNRKMAEAILKRELPSWPRPGIPVSPQSTKSAMRALAELGWSLQGPPGIKDGFWIVCAGNAEDSELRNWPLEKWAALLANAVRQHRIRLLFVGCGEDLASSVSIREAMGDAASHSALLPSEHACWDTMAGLLALSHGYIGRDTGPMHLAGALNKPVFSIFGGGHWPQFLPLASEGTVLTYQVPCQGCGWICHLEQSHCVKAIPLGEGQHLLSDFLSAPRKLRTVLLPLPPSMSAKMIHEAASRGRDQLWINRQQNNEIVALRHELNRVKETL